jgi:hypothetical protein
MLLNETGVRDRIGEMSRSYQRLKLRFIATVRRSLLGATTEWGATVRRATPQIRSQWLRQRGRLTPSGTRTVIRRWVR